jgi:cobalt-zinc-cadmium efflux system membrane fusion protein
MHIKKLFSTMNIFTGVSVGLFSFFIISCSKPKTSEQPKATFNTEPTTLVTLTEEQFATVNLQVEKLEQRSVSGSIKANGMLDVPPQNLVTISAPIGGFVKHTELLQGMKVKKGQLLVTLEHQDYIQLQQDYLDNKSQLEFLELDYQRQQELARENVNAAKALQQARSNYFSTKAKVQGLKEKLHLINIDTDLLEKGTMSSTISLYSPIEGYITQVNINIGMHVNPADMMIRIVDSEHLHAEAQVFEKDVSKLKVGQKVHLTLSNETRERNATVYLVGKEMTAERTIRVHCHLTDEDHSLIPGTYFNAVIETSALQVRCLPEKAVVTFDGKEYVFKVNDEAKREYEMIEVTTGQASDGFKEVILPQNVSPETLFVTVGSYDLLSFLKNTEE